MQIHQYNTGGLVKPFFANRGKNSLTNNLFYYRSLHVKCRTIVAHNNTVQRHFIAKVVFLGGSESQGEDSWKVSLC